LFIWERIKGPLAVYTVSNSANKKAAGEGDFLLKTQDIA